MAGMTSKTIAATYKGLLKTAGDNVAVPTGSTGVNVVDGEENVTALYLTDGEVGIGTSTPASLLETKRSDTGVHWTLDRGGDDVATIGASAAGISIESDTTITLNDDEGDVDTKINCTSGIALIVEGSSGNVGIGTDAPAEKLHVYHDTSTEWTAFFDQNHATGYGVKIDVDSASTHPALRINSVSDTIFEVEGNGHVGIGTATPAGPLDVGVGTAAWSYSDHNSIFSRGVVIGRAGDAEIYNAPNVIFRRSYSGAEDDYTDLNDNVVATHTLGNLIFQGYRGGWEEAARIAVDVEADGSGYLSGRMEFHTTNTSGAQVLGLQIVGDQDVLPGGDRTQHLGSVAKEWDQVHCVNATEVSDIRLKDNIEDSVLGLDFISKLRPVSYTMKDSSYEAMTERPVDPVEAKDAVLDGDGNVVEEAIIGVEAKQPVYETQTITHSRKHYGLIAQEVKVVLDDMNIDTKDFGGYVDGNINDDGDKLLLRYRQFIAPMMKAIQELSAKVTALENA